MTISLCIVARNEAHFIARAIASARAVVDQVVVVDTGSTDGTPDLARKAGAEVASAPWPGDLAKAHDLPLELATRDWILVLDADEALDPSAADQLPMLVHGPADGYRFTVRNYDYRPGLKWRSADPADPLTLGAPGWSPSWAVRLFRNDSRYRNRGRLHQSVQAAILAAGGSIADTVVPIHHYGMLRLDRQKGAFYIQLAGAEVADVQDAPEAPRAWLELGVAQASAGDTPSARESFARAFQLSGDPAAAFHLGRCLLDGREPDAAARLLDVAVSANGRDDSLDFDLADAWEELARAREAQGDLAGACGAYRAALSSRPDSPVALTNLAGLLLEIGRLDEAESTIDRLPQRYRGFSQSWSLRAALALRRRDRAAARRSLEIAVDCDPLLEAPRHALGRLTGRAAVSMAVDAELPSGALVSLADHLVGGAGRVIVDIARAFAGQKPSAVVTGDAGDAGGEGFADELREMGVPVIVVQTEDEARRTLERLEPLVVLHHLAALRFPSPLRSGSTRWIAVGHSMLPMRSGYDAYVTLSPFQAQFQTHLDGRVVRIPNGVDLARFPIHARPAARRPLTIVSLGRLSPGKFPYRLLEHLPDLEALDARLLIAGRGSRRWDLEPEIVRRGLAERVQFVGPIRSHDVPAFLLHADVGLHLTEIAEEVHSLTILEMLAAQLPVVSQPRGCVPELVTDGVNGFLGEEAPAISAALSRLLESPGLRRELGAAGRTRAEIYSIERMHVRYRALVEGLSGAQHG